MFVDPIFIIILILHSFNEEFLVKTILLLTYNIPLNVIYILFTMVFFVRSTWKVTFSPLVLEQVVLSPSIDRLAGR